MWQVWLVGWTLASRSSDPGSNPTSTACKKISLSYSSFSVVYTLQGVLLDVSNLLNEGLLQK